MLKIYAKLFLFAIIAHLVLKEYFLEFNEIISKCYNDFSIPFFCILKVIELSSIRAIQELQ